MTMRASRRLAAGILSLAGLAAFASAQANPSLKDIIEKNIQASGGKEKLAQIQNFSFKSGSTRYYATSAGELKFTTGKDPVVTEAVLVRWGKVQRNYFNETTELTGIRKATNEVLAKLYGGLFSLIRFQGQLDYQGLKAYGPEKLHHLSTKAEPLQVNFFLLQDDFRLKRLVFQGQTPEGEKYEVNYDFASFEDVEGVTVPLSWFSSQVGTRGTLVEISEVKVNQLLDKNFFAKAEVNVGATEAKPGRLKGNVLDANASPNGFTAATNWMKKDIDKAGFKTGDKLSLIVEDTEIELVFYATANELPPQPELAKGARILAPQPRGGDTFAIQFFGGDAGGFAAKFKVLAPIEITRK
jgi:hypothetical protein